MKHHAIKSCLMTTLISAFFTILIGCGFHLKLPVQWPEAYQKIAIRESSESSSSLASTLKNRLIQQKRIVVDGIDADLTITIVNQNYTTREIASSFDGRNREYTLTLTALISIENKQGEFLLSNAEFSASREQQLDETNVLGNSDSSLRTEIENQVLDAILRRLQATVQAK